MRLIINADDFGFSKSVNEAIFVLARLGSLTSTTVMVNMPYANKAKELLRLNKFGVGLHFNLTQGKPISERKTISSLVNSSGEFYSFKDFRIRSKKGLVEKGQVFKELQAQYKKLYDIIGDRITHLDSHQAVHKYKPVSDAVYEFGKQKKINGIRSPQHYFINKNYKIERPVITNIIKYGPKRIITEAYYHYYNRKFSKYYKIPNGELLNYSFKKVDTLIALSDIVKNSTTMKITLEISCHPAISVDDLPKSKLTKKRVKEYEIMKSNEFKNSLQKFQLINFSQI